MRSLLRRVNLPLRFVTGVMLALLLALVVFNLVMRPGRNDLGLMALFLGFTSMITLLVGYTAYRLGWINRAPSLRWALLGTYALSSLLILLNVWVTARLMFVSEHDLLLGTILLFFAGNIAMVLGYFFSEALTQRITALNHTIHEIRQRRLGARVKIEGRDEIAGLAKAFNEMASHLEAMARRQKELESLKRDLIAWVGHDLQTPLASIRAIIEALADGMVEDPQTAQRYLNTAQRDIQSLSRLIDDLFEMAKLDAGGLKLDLQANALSDLISDTLESFSTLAAEKHVKLEGEIHKNVDPVVMDAHRIGRVLNNLVRNALHHTPPGGKVHVCAKPFDKGVEVEVRDTGEGLSPEDLPHIFEHFYRGEKSRNRATGGTGLGLAIARGFIQAHGGEIYAETLPEGGARFFFTLPTNSV